VDDVSTKIRFFIGTELMARDDGASVTAETRLLRGATDSLGIVRLLLFLQEEFRLTFSEAEVDPDNFRTVADVERLVRERLAHPGETP
jgi:acyl carrier protein